MFNLEYLIIYQNDGTPVYSRCFGDMCKIGMKDDVLFSGFLSALSTFASYSEEERVDEISLNNISVMVEYDQDRKLNSLIMADLRLIFLYSQMDDFTIAAGFNSEEYDKYDGYNRVRSFLDKVEEFMSQHDDINWNYVETETLLAFESELLRMVIHPFFSEHSIKAQCPFGDNCPLRMAMYEGEGETIYERLKHKLKEYRGKNMFSKMKMMMFGSKYKSKN